MRQLDPTTATECSDRSHAALNTTARMIATAAADHTANATNIDSLPLCCAYNLRFAVSHAALCSSVGDMTSFPDAESLKILQGAFATCWRGQSAE